MPFLAGCNSESDKIGYFLPQLSMFVEAELLLGYKDGALLLENRQRWLIF